MQDRPAGEAGKYRHGRDRSTMPDEHDDVALVGLGDAHSKAGEARDRTPAGAAQQPAGQASAPVVNVQALGPQVGARIPDFTLVDQNGATRTLRSLMGPKGLMLVLFRSADW
jgi:hypothetical protein